MGCSLLLALTNASMCTYSNSDPVWMARDEGTQESKETSSGCWINSQVLNWYFFPLFIYVFLFLQLHFVCIFNFMPHICLFSRFIKGFIYRHEEYCPENAYFLDHVRYSFLKNLRKSLPRSVLDKSWPTPPPSLVEVTARTHKVILLTDSTE